MFGSRNELMLARGRIRPLFFRYAVPGAVAMLFLAFQSVIDGLIVGRLIGADALASVNIATPSYTLMTAFALIIGIGTQAQMGIHMGRGDYVRAKSAFRSGTVLIIASAAAFTVLIIAFAEGIAGFLGADGVLLAMSAGYIRGLMPMLTGLCCFFFFDYVLKALGHPRYAMTVMVCTILLNFGLSMLFVGGWGMGTFGVGLGTGLSFTLGMAASAAVVFRQIRANPNLRKVNSGFSWRIIGRIFYNGSSEGLAEISMGITLFLFNITLMEYAGREGVAAFTIINYIVFVGASFSLGVANGVIPVISYNYGAGRSARVLATVRMAVAANFVLGVVFLSVLWLAGGPVVRLFLDSSETGVIDMAVYGARIVSLGFLVSGFNIFAASFFTAVDKAGLSLGVASLRGLVLLSVGILTLPRIWGIDGIWLTVTLSEAITFVVAFFLMHHALKKVKSGA